LFPAKKVGQTKYIGPLSVILFSSVHATTRFIPVSVRAPAIHKNPKIENTKGKNGAASSWQAAFFHHINFILIDFLTFFLYIKN